MRYSLIGYALSMRLMMILLFITSVASVNAETVYKTVDKDGNIIFTDKPSENAEEIKLQELQTIKNPNPSRYTPKSKPLDNDDATSYKTFFVASPADGSGLRSNSGNVSISLTLEPSLRRGHKVVISLDGKEISNGPATSASLQNLDRGTHSISASVIDNNGKKLTSTSSSFSLLRASQ